MSDNIKNIQYDVLFILIFGLALSIQAVNATSYEQWRAQQARHDIRLAQMAKQPINLDHGQIIIKKSDVEPQKNPDINRLVSEQPLGTGIRVNINRATAQELSAKLESIGSKKAQEIIKYRKKHGDFKHIDELKNVKGIGEKIFLRNKDRLKLTD